MAHSKRRKASKPSYPKWLLPVAAIVVIAALIGGVMLLTKDDKASADTLISPKEYTSDFDTRDHLLVDVRTVAEFNEGHIEGAINIPVEELDQRLDELPQDETIVVYCRSGNRSADAADMLDEAGYSSVYDIDGGVIAWSADNLPLVR